MTATFVRDTTELGLCLGIGLLSFVLGLTACTRSSDPVAPAALPTNPSREARFWTWFAAHSQESPSVVDNGGSYTLKLNSEVSVEIVKAPARAADRSPSMAPRPRFVPTCSR